MDVVIHNSEIKKLLREDYLLDQIEEIESRLNDAGAFHFPALSNGLYPAAVSHDEDYEYTGYHNVWVRDNIHVAHSRYVCGEIEPAVECVRSLAKFFTKYIHRLDAMIAGTADKTVQMERPHIRFNGDSLEENAEEWPHIQNDALGYFVWFFCLLANNGQLQPGESEIKLLSKFVQYFKAIEFWQDEDSGHWEETRKIEASSIGAVVAGLRELDRLNLDGVAKSEVEFLIQTGSQALDEILPAECIQPDPSQNRRYDSALLFLIYPLNLFGSSPSPNAETIIAEVVGHLLGPYGIRRYLNDSYWCTDYKAKLSPKERTGEFSGDLESRDALMTPGEEAQWCIFDSIISCIYGQWFLDTKDSEYLERQTHYLNRSLGQLTAEDSAFGPLKCPESYYVENGKYVPNDITPLLWTQANLRLALHHYRKSLSAGPGAPVE